MIESENAIIKGKDNITEMPFAMALRELAVSRGYESQHSLSKALGKKNGETVNGWYKGIKVPAPDQFASLLVLFQPDDQKLEEFVEAYAQEIAKRRIYRHSIDTRLKISKSNTNSSEYPVGQWIENYAVEKGITLTQFFKAFGFAEPKSKNRDKLNLDALSWLLQNAQKILDLSEDQIESLSEAVVLTIQQRLKKGQRFQEQDGPRGKIVKKMQKGLEYKTYNGAEAAGELGVSRERVSKLRKRLGFPLLLTEEQVGTLREYFVNTKDIREWQKEVRKQKQTIPESSSL